MKNCGFHKCAYFIYGRNTSNNILDQRKIGGKTFDGLFTTFKDSTSKDLDYYTHLVIDVYEINKIEDKQWEEWLL